jgi:UDP-N-acetylmuramate: L-alanyl-gamma-D-glutamyl-meso-diaminopimelate ligase
MRVHFIAIGGAAMHNLALALQNKGYEVSGSDDVIFDPSKSRLEASGLLPDKEGWFPNKITGEIDAIILGMHAKIDNPELVKAQSLNLNIYSYPEFIYLQSKAKTRVVIGGSHGKTTIVSMILHVLKYHGKSCDFMVGAQIEGFDVMVNLTDHNDFIILEGDEYLSSPIDLIPKFHHYKPNIALLSGIAWDHINVFPNFEDYKYQFSVFINSIISGGSITYNSEDIEVKQIVEQSDNPIKKFPYTTPDFYISNGITFLNTNEGPIPLNIFGKHNLSNIAGAKWICQQMGIDEDDFYEGISSFLGASRRLERIFEFNTTVVFKDFAHAPSKVSATTCAVKKQFPNRKLIACLELHTYSSLNENFISEYQNTLKYADEAIVFYSAKSIEIKKIKEISFDKIETSFKHKKLNVFNNTPALEKFLKSKDYEDTSLLFMSSGNYGGLNINNLKYTIENKS